MKQKGFLFTIGIIFFASTLIFYTQFFFDANLVLEKNILNNSVLLNVIQLNDDLSFDLLGVLRTNFDVNSRNNYLLISGEINSNEVVSSRINSFKNFLENNYFSRSVFSKSIDLTSIENKSRFFVGNKTWFDYNYGNSVALVNTVPDLINSIDLNISSSTSTCLTNYEWNKNSGGISVVVNYVNDCNNLSFSGSISGAENSFLELIHEDGGIELIEFGGINYLGESFVDSVYLESIPGKRIDYNLGVGFREEVLLYPVRTSVVLKINSLNIDSNSFLIILK